MNYQKEKTKIIPLYIASKRITNLGINLTKAVKDLYPENYKTLVKDIENDTKKMEKYPMLLD